jgi:hypothetical protein
MDPEHAARFRAEITDLGLADVVELLGEVSRDAALDMVNRSHLALVLAQNQPLQTPAKLYESMGMRVPTLVLTEPTSASAREARRVGAIACGADDVNAIRRVIEDLWKGSVAPAQNAPGFSYEHLASQVNAMLSADAAKQTTGGTTDT